MKTKGLGFYFGALSALLGLIGLIVFFVYTGQGGAENAGVIVATIAAILCEVSLLVGEKVYSDFTGIAGAVLLALAMMLTLSGGVGNMADAFQGIVMFGDAKLAGLNYAMAGLYGAGTLAAICACFMKKSK